ncbi:MAG TPA: hypothetical protein VJB96_04345 [Patescibacteria group bacterium]|nr:hypothetical protein [Patescibacteria group bacterium]
MTTVIALAKRALTACSTRDGFIAGTHHFVDLWARDSLFAAWATSDPVTVNTFFRFQRSDGAIPYRIFRRHGHVWPNFHSVQSGGFVPDGGLMAVIAATRFGKRFQHDIDKALIYYKHRFEDQLISEWFQCEWADAVLKVGKTLYTNVLYWKATGDSTIKKKINETFWNGEFFADWVDYKRQDYFASHPNMLAIVWGLATQKQAESILRFARKHCWNGWALRSNVPHYPWWRIPIQNHLVGLSDYCNGLYWLQPGILYAVSLKKTGSHREANAALRSIGEKIIEFNGVFEVYEKSGHPVRRLLYRSEEPFAWSAGLFLWAHSIIVQNKKQ